MGVHILPSTLSVEFLFHTFCESVIVIVISKLLKSHLKAKSRAQAYSRALRQIRGVVQRIVRWRLGSGCQRVIGGRLAGVVYECMHGEKEECLCGNIYWVIDYL